MGAITLLVAACSPVPPVPSNTAPATQTATASQSSVPSPAAATLIVTQAFIGEGFYTEGAHAYVELWDSTGVLVGHAETIDYRIEEELARFTVDAGRFDLRSHVRSCNSACPALDPPTAACAASIELQPGFLVTILIERTLRSCEVRSL